MAMNLPVFRAGKDIVLTTRQAVSMLLKILSRITSGILSHAAVLPF
jgi:hypothetical protein